jgi:hypothetical protein
MQKAPAAIAFALAQGVLERASTPEKLDFPVDLGPHLVDSELPRGPTGTAETCDGRSYGKSAIC